MPFIELKIHLLVLLKEKRHRRQMSSEERLCRKNHSEGHRGQSMHHAGEGTVLTNEEDMRANT